MITLERIQPETISIILRDQNGVVTRTITIAAFQDINITKEEYLGTRRIISQLVVTGNIAIRGDLPLPIDPNATTPPPSSGAAFALPYGGGSDGDISVVNGQVLNLTRSIFCISFSVSPLGIVNLNGFKIFCRIALLNEGIIKADGNNGTIS